MHESIEYNSRVVIHSGKYHNRVNGLTGTVRYIGSSSSIGVSVDGVENNASSYGYFYFPSSSLTICHEGSCPDMKGEHDMAKETIMDGAFRIAVVHFLEGYNTDVDYFYACYDDTIQVEDKCVVRTGHHGFALAKVLRFVTEEQYPQPITREIVAKVDFTAYDQRQFVRKRSAELLKALDAKAAAAQKLMVYQSLAAADPEMQALLAEYTSLVGGNAE